MKKNKVWIFIAILFIFSGIAGIVVSNLRYPSRMAYGYGVPRIDQRVDRDEWGYRNDCPFRFDEDNERRENE